MFMEAYTMSAQAQQFFPLSSLFQILNLDGKDRILPVIQENEHYQEQMQALQQQVEQMGAQMEQMQNENQNLRKAVSQTTNALAQMGARRGGGAVVNQTGGPMKMAEAGGGQNTSNAVVEQARSTLGMPTGAELPA
jgi:TolA-binding protein